MNKDFKNLAYIQDIYVHTSSLFIKTGKGIADHILRISPIQFLSKHGQKHGEVDRAWGFIHHSLQVFLCGILTWKVDNSNEDFLPHT